jgi:hypothetical protein
VEEGSMSLTPHPALAQLERFIGTWDVTANFGGQVMGGVAVTFEWLEGGAFLVERTVAENLDGVPAEILANSPLPTTRIIGYDDSAEVFTVLYADRRGVARVYQMRLVGDRWDMARDAPGFGQRFTAEFDAEGRTISGRWEMSSDNETWEHDFAMTYARRG